MDDGFLSGLAYALPPGADISQAENFDTETVLGVQSIYTCEGGYITIPVFIQFFASENTNATNNHAEFYAYDPQGQMLYAWQSTMAMNVAQTYDIYLAIWNYPYVAPFGPTEFGRLGVMPLAPGSTLVAYTYTALNFKGSRFRMQAVRIPWTQNPSDLTRAGIEPHGPARVPPRLLL